jgi:hypothetical protein
MKTDRRAQVRGLLLAAPDGLTLPEIADLLIVDPSTVRYALRAMPDCYIDRWVKPARGCYSPVWCAVSVPEHCPRPDDA